MASQQGGSEPVPKKPRLACCQCSKGSRCIRQGVCVCRANRTPCTTCAARGCTNRAVDLGPAVECAPPCRTSGSPGNQAVTPAPPLHVSLSVSTSPRPLLSSPLTGAAAAQAGVATSTPPRPLLSSPLTGAQAGVATSTSHSTGPHQVSER
ncbi:uncharacterized protein [Littorina saxatilis]|uniref:uncharacterized protein n=1 Tax=Littorina saxatilis TaxID=31220 RepID=UPI0038B446CA